VVLRYCVILLSLDVMDDGGEDSIRLVGVFHEGDQAPIMSKVVWQLIYLLISLIAGGVIWLV